MAKVMVFAPHPDDDVIACGGSMARHVQKGDAVCIVYLSSGEAGSLTHPLEELAKIREAEATRAAGILGVKDLLFLGNPDGYISFTREAIEPIIRLIRDKKPSLVYLPHENEAVRDHQESFHLVKEACKRAAGPWFQNCGQEAWSTSVMLAYEVWTPLQKVSLAEDISDFMSIKLAALREHQSQLADIAYDEAIQGLNRYRAITSGIGKYCECFQVIKSS